MVNEELRLSLADKAIEGDYSGYNFYDLEEAMPSVFEDKGYAPLPLPSVDEFMELPGIISTLHGSHCDGSTTLQIVETNEIEVVCIPKVSYPHSHDCVIELDLYLTDTQNDVSLEYPLCGMTMSWEQFNPRHIEEGVAVCYEQMLRYFCIQMEDDDAIDVVPFENRPPRFWGGLNNM